MGFELRKIWAFLPLASLVLSSWLLSSCSSDSPTTPIRVGCQVSPDSIDFGLTVLQRQKLKEVSITNTGNTMLTIEVSRPNSPFGVVFAGDGPVSLPPGSTKRITITYAPQTAGKHSTVIALGNDACATVYCKGEGYLDPNEACLGHPHTLEFNQVRLGESADGYFLIRNQGTVQISGTISEACGPFQITAGSGPFTLNAAESLKVAVRFQPTTVGLQLCSISFGSGFCPPVLCRGIGIRERTWRIEPDGSGDAPTIQAGIDSSYDTDTVLVAAGTYYEAVNFSGKKIVVMSESGAGTTYLDGSRLEEPIVTFDSAETRAAVLEGFTLQLSRRSAIVCDHASPVIRNNHLLNNVAAEQFEIGWGGGVDASGSPLIESNLFEANESFANGGAMELNGDSPVVRGNVFQGNRSAYDGGAIFVFGLSGEGLIENNLFVGNVGGDHGGAMEIGYQGSNLTIKFNVFANNVAKGNDGPSDTGTGGALSIRSSDDVFLENNTFVLNEALNWATCTGSSILFDTSSNCEVSRNIIYGAQGCVIECRGTNSGISFVDNLFWGNQPDQALVRCGIDFSTSNLFADPMFCDENGGDYRLTAGSPAILSDRVIGAFGTPGCGALTSGSSGGQWRGSTQ